MEHKPFKEFYRIGPLVFMHRSFTKEDLLSRSYDRVDFGVDPEGLSFYQCGIVTTIKGKPCDNFFVCMYDSPFLVPFVCWYLRHGSFIAIHQYETGWLPNYHPVIRSTVSPAGIKELQYWSLDMDGIFIFRSQGGTYEPMAHLFDELRSDRPEDIRRVVWMFPREKTDVKGLIERIPVRGSVFVESFPPSDDGPNGRIRELDDIDDLGEVVRYRLAFSDMLPDKDKFGHMLPDLNVWLK